jgi:hypothetical protein
MNKDDLDRMSPDDYYPDNDLNSPIDFPEYDDDYQEDDDWVEEGDYSEDSFDNVLMKNGTSEGHKIFFLLRGTSVIVTHLGGDLDQIPVEGRIIPGLTWEEAVNFVNNDVSIDVAMPDVSEHNKEFILYGSSFEF